MFDHQLAADAEDMAYPFVKAVQEAKLIRCVFPEPV
jgi:hypothetical protein